VIDLIVSAFGEVDEKQAPDQLAFDDPNLHLPTVSFQQALVDILDQVWFLKTLDLLNEFGFAAFPSLDGIGFSERPIIVHPGGHEAVFHEEMIDEVLLLSWTELAVDPKLILGDKRKTEMLAEIGELFVDGSPDQLPVNYPDRDGTDIVQFLDIRLLHGEYIITQIDLRMNSGRSAFLVIGKKIG
jgi:hypothetical protein